MTPGNGKRWPTEGQATVSEDHQANGIDTSVPVRSMVRPEDRAAAVARAEQIRATAHRLGALLEEANAAKDWQALGYGSWAAYLKGEFQISRSRGYQLIDHERFLRELGPSTFVDTLDLPEGLSRHLHGWAAELRFRLAVGARHDGEDDRTFSRRAAQQLIDDIEAAPRLVEFLNAREDLRPITLPLFDFADHWSIPAALRQQLRDLDQILAGDENFRRFLAEWSPHLTTVPEVVHRMGYDGADEARLDAFLLQVDVG